MSGPFGFSGLESRLFSKSSFTFRGIFLFFIEVTARGLLVTAFRWLKRKASGSPKFILFSFRTFQLASPPRSFTIICYLFSAAGYRRGGAHCLARIAGIGRVR